MTILDISLKMIKKFLVVLGVVDMRQLLLSINHGPVKCAKVCDKSVVMLVNTACMQTVIYKLESFIFSSKVGPLDFHTY